MTPKDILQLESTDIRQAYLFEENGRWYAYEHSANRIEKFVKGFVDFKHKVQDVCGRIKIEIDINVLENAPLRCVKTPCLYSIALQHKSGKKYKHQKPICRKIYTDIVCFVCVPHPTQRQLAKVVLSGWGFLLMPRGKARIGNSYFLRIIFVYLI